MAPKKKLPTKKESNKDFASSIPNSNHKKPSKVPKLLISAEDEDHLRRLLLNFRRITSPVTAHVHSTLSKTQKKTKLTNLYSKLSCEGFLDDQIEAALSSLTDRATFETALDWLCLNLSSHELPVKFSAAVSRHPTTGGSVSVISTSKKDWNESAEPTIQQKQQVKEPEVIVRVKGKRDEEDTLLSSSCQSSQADWIRQYMKRLEEEESESSSDDELSGPRPFDVIAEEFCLVRSEAIKAKREGDKTGQKQAGLAICKLSQEISTLGISESILESEFQREQTFEGATEKEIASPLPDDVHESSNVDADSFEPLEDLTLDANPTRSCLSVEIQPKALPSSSSGQELVMSDDILDGMELGDLFLEDAPPYEPSPHDLLELQKKEIMKELCNEQNLGKLEGIWKKGEGQKIPKALLHRLCQKSGWEAPKFNKVTGEGSDFSYTVSVLRKYSKSGQSRQAGGLITLRPPHQVEDFESVEDAQNRVAAFALHKLFSDLPVYFAITEPYASLVLTWKQEESLGIKNKEEERREKFVDSLLEADNFSSTTSSSGIHDSLPVADSCVREIDDLVDVVKSSHKAKNFSMEAECSSLKQKQENNKKMQKYKALEPPSEGAMNSAISLLHKVGALEGDEELTPLGHHLANLPVDVLIGKMLLYGGIFGCLSPILSIAAFLSYKSPFIYPKDEKQNLDRVKLALLSDKLEKSSDVNNNNRQSDHLLMVVAYEKWVKILHEEGIKAAERFCDSKFLSSSVMHVIRDLRIQFGTLLANLGIIDLPKTDKCGERGKDNIEGWFADRAQPFNMHSQEPEVVKAILCAGLSPNIAEGLVNRLTKPEKQTQRYSVWYDGRREVHIHQSSINKNCKAFQYPYLVFLDKVESKKVVYLRDTTVVSPFSILLFGGSINVHHQSGSVTIDGWLKLAAPVQTAVLFKELRLSLHSILKDLIRKPEIACSNQKSGIVHNEVVKSMVHLLIEEGKPQPK